MDMKLDRAKLKALRESRAWSQTHLADASGISLRTIQRIEKSGVASPESVKSLCATLGIQVGDLSISTPQQSENAPSPSGLARLKITRRDKIATLVTTIIAFAIAYLWSSNS